MDELKNVEWITTKEASNLTGYHPASIRQYIQAGHLTGEKRGRDWFVLRHEVLEYAQRMQRMGTRKHIPYQHRKRKE